MDSFEQTLSDALAAGKIELLVEFRHADDGTKSGAIEIRSGDGTTVTTLHVETPEAMNVALARLVERGFRMVAPSPEPRLTEPPARLRTPVPVAGVDGYRQGWVAVSLDPSGDV